MRIHLWQVIFLSFLRELKIVDDSFTRRLMEEEQVSSEEITQFSETISKIVEDTMYQVIARVFLKYKFRCDAFM